MILAVTLAAARLEAQPVASEWRHLRGDASVGLVFAATESGGTTPVFGVHLRAPAATPWSGFAEVQVRERFTDFKGPVLLGAFGIARLLTPGVHARALAGRLVDRDYLALSIRVLGGSAGSRADAAVMGMEGRFGATVDGHGVAWFTLFVAAPFGT